MKAMLVAAVAVFLGVSGVAHASYSPILTANAPANGTFPTFTHIKTSKMKLEKSGSGCATTRMNFTAVGKDLNGFPILLGLESLGQTSSGASIYKVVPTATIFEFQLTTVRYQPGTDCVYTFSAYTIDDQE